MAYFSRRLELLECGKEELEKQLQELIKTNQIVQQKEIEEQNKRIQTSRCQMEKSKLKISELEAKAIESDLKVESLLSKVYYICG